MAKKALLVGVNTYPAPASELKAPVREAKKWAKLLSEVHKFDEVTVLPELQATRQGVLDALRKLLNKASKGDLLFLGFAGHGAHVNGWISDIKTSQTKEHGLIVYTPSVDKKTGFQRASITPSDIARILEHDLRVPAEVVFVIGLDCCFAAAFGGGIGADDRLVNPKVLFIPNAVPNLDPEKRAVTFAEIRGLISDASIAVPMIVAAAESTQTAVEVGPALERRLLFSRQAIRRLRTASFKKTEISTETLVNEINPLRPKKQNAIIVGNTDPQDDPFGGGFSQSKPQPVSTPAALLSEGSEAAAVRSRLGDIQPSSREEVAQWSIEMRVFGMAVFIDRPEDDESAYRSRIVFPFDTFKKDPDDPDHHFAFIEVANADMPRPPIGTEPVPYSRAGIPYSRWDLDGHTVRFENVPASGQPIERIPPFEDHVPGLTRTAPELEDYPPRSECFEDPQPELFSGFIDLQAGSVRIGELEEFETDFKGYGPNPTWTGKTPLNVRLTLPLTEQYVVITIEDDQGNITAVWVNHGATIVAGNARLADLFGPGSGDNADPKHFGICYSVTSKERVYDPGFPEKQAMPINACTVTTYP